MAGLSSITSLSNQFKELKYASPDVAYAKACKDLQSGEWETQTSAVEMMVTIARRNPEVKLYYIDKVKNVSLAQRKIL